MKIDGRFVYLLDDLIESFVFQECPAPALKILIAIAKDWLDRGMRDNGNLIVSYKMIMLKTGIHNKRLISLSLKQLVALGLLTMNSGSFDRRAPNRYGLAWVSGPNGGPPPKQYLEIRSREEARRLLDRVKQPRKPSRKIRVTVEFEDI